MKRIAFKIALAIVLASCSDNSKVNSTQAEFQASNSNSESATNSIAPPIPGINLKSELITVSNASGIVSETNRGTIVVVPPDVFVYEDGSPVKGDVKVEVQEIFTQSEIILSGIPMNVEHDGVIEPFISDGMFKISASADNKPVKIAKGKSIQVCNESHKDSKDFDYWYFDEKKGRWDNLGDRGQTSNFKQVTQVAETSNPQMAKRYLEYRASSSVRNQTRMESADNAGKASRTNEVRYKAGSDDVVNLSGDDFVFSINASYDNYPELSSYKNVIWRSIKKLSATEEAQFEKDMQSFGSNILINCVDEEKLIYNLEYAGKNMRVQPILTDGGKRAREQFKEMQKSYDIALKEKNKEMAKQKRIAQNAATVYNVFTVMDLGIYNCDRFYNSPKASGMFVIKLDSKKLDNCVYAILENGQGVIALSQAYLKNGRYKIPSSDVAGFIHVDSEGVIYKSAHLDQGAKEYDVSLKNCQKSVSEDYALQEIIESL